MATGYRGQVKGVHLCPICGKAQTLWGASKAQVEASKQIAGIIDMQPAGEPFSPAQQAAINELIQPLQEAAAALCQCSTTQRCACDVLGTLCIKCRQRQSWCKCGGFGFNERGTCIYCRTNVEPWMFAVQAPTEFKPAKNTILQYL